MKTTKKRDRSVNKGFVRHAPNVLIVSTALFILAALLLGEGFGAYEKFWWWDDALHTISGIIVGLIGFLMVYFFNAKYNMHISPVFVAVFAFTFAITMGVLWEVFEFCVDVFLGGNMQRWNLPADAPLIGKAYQGSGLRDTMSDLIVAGIGSLGAAVVAYYAYKHEKTTSLSIMRRTVGRFRNGTKK